MKARNVPPAELMTYDPPTRDALEWEAGFERWLADRAAWAASLGIDLAELPPSHIGAQPFDPRLI